MVQVKIISWEFGEAIYSNDFLWTWEDKVYISDLVEISRESAISSIKVYNYIADEDFEPPEEFGELDKGLLSEI